MNMQNIEGQSIPQTTFQVLGKNGLTEVTTDDIFNGRSVVVFALPGAFTPTCSSSHLPRYEELAASFRRSGIDEIVCISVNDGFVMKAWADSQSCNAITCLPDGSGTFTAGMGALVNKDNLGFGMRSWRYAMLVRDGIIEKMFIEANEPGDPFEVSDADSMLNYINPDAEKPKKIAVFSKPDCTYCKRAKQMLDEAGLDYEEVVLGGNSHGTSLLMAVTGATTVPQVFVGGERLGGSEALEQWLQA